MNNMTTNSVDDQVYFNLNTKVYIEIYKVLNSMLNDQLYKQIAITVAIQLRQHLFYNLNDTICNQFDRSIKKRLHDELDKVK